MKKRILAILLTVAMLVSLMPATMLSVSAEESTENTEAVVAAHSHCDCGGSGADHTCNDEQAWEAWEKTDSLPTSGCYFLTADVVLTKVTELSNNELKLCLNGYTVTGAGTAGVFSLGHNGTDKLPGGSLTITDCQGTGKITNNAADVQGGIIYARPRDDMQINIYAGTLENTCEAATKNGGIICAQGGAVNIYGGVMTGGVGSGTSAENNGGVLYISNDVQINMYGGIINGGTGYKRGGAVALDHANASFNMYGGTINGGTASYGKVIINKGTVKIAGGTIINTNEADKTIRNWDGGAVLQISEASFPNGFGVESTTDNYKYLNQVLAENAMYVQNGEVVTVSDTANALTGEIQVVTHEAHCACNGAVDGHDCAAEAWTPWFSNNSLPTSGCYFLTADVVLTKVTELSNNELKLCLNGYTVTGAGTAGVFNLGHTDGTQKLPGGVLAITDCQKSGKITNNAAAVQGGIIYARPRDDMQINIYAGTLENTCEAATKNGGIICAQGGAVNIYGGVMTGGVGSGTSAENNGGVLYVTNAVQINMYGGTINGGTGYKRGGAVALDHANASFNMYGGTINGGTASYGKVIINKGTVNIAGGTIINTNESDKTIRNWDGGAVLQISEASFPNGFGVESTTDNYKYLNQVLAAGSYYAVDGVYTEVSDETANLKGNVAVVGHADHCVCTGNVDHDCTDVEWTAWTDSTKLPTGKGNYFLACDVTLSKRVEYLRDTDLNICLNGHTITSTATNGIFWLGATAADETATEVNLSISDCSGNGKITYAVPDEAEILGGIVRTRNHNASTFNLYSGKLEVTGTAKIGGVLYINAANAEAEANIYGGEIVGEEASDTGAVAYVANGDAINVYGGAIYGGKAVSAGAVRVLEGAELNLLGGTVYGGTANNGGAIYNEGVVNISGDAKLMGGTALEGYGGTIYVTGKGTLNTNGGSISNVADIATAKSGGVIYSIGLLNINGTEISGGHASTSPSGGTIAVAGGTASISNSTLTAGWGSRGTCINVNNEASLTVTDSVINGRTEVYGTSGLGTCCWIERGGQLTLVGDVKITGEGLDVIRDLRLPEQYQEAMINLENWNATEPLSVRRQDNKPGAVVYVGANTAAVANVVPFLANQKLIQNTEAQTLDIDLYAVVVYGLEEGEVKALSGYDTFTIVEGATYYQLQMDLDGVVIDQNILLDLAGHTMTNVTVNEGVTVRLMDSATDDYTGSYGSFSGSINGNVETFVKTAEEETGAVKSYLVVSVANVYSAHRYYAGMTNVSLRPGQDALGYKAEFYGDDMVMAFVTECGFNMEIQGLLVDTYSVDGLANDALTLRVQNILKCKTGEINISAQAYIVFSINGDTVTEQGAVHTTSMKQTLQAVNAAWDTLSAEQQAAVKALCTAYAEPAAWELDKIYA